MLWTTLNGAFSQVLAAHPQSLPVLIVCSVVLSLTNSLLPRPVTGSVDVRLHKANIMCRGRSSPHSLYNEDLVSMDIAGGFDATNSTGFIKTLATRLQASAARDKALY